VSIRVSVPSFGGPEVLRVENEAPRASPGRSIRVRVTHASVGSTDALARSGGYLLQPRPGFTPGYDFVGVVESGDRTTEAQGWSQGTRVAGCLARMGSNRTFMDVRPTLLVRIPDSIPSAVAAALPVDLLTAGLATSLAGPLSTPSVLVQGVSGAVGSLIAQHYLARGVTVLGTASARSRRFAEERGVQVFDYRDPDWLRQVRSASPDGVGAIFDHTGATSIRAAAAHGGTVVHTAFVGRPGHERIDTFLGGGRAVVRYFSHPRDRVCSVPLLISTRPGRYRSLLTAQFDRIVTGELRAPTVRLIPIDDVARAHQDLNTLDAGEKIVLALDD
jgi:NADPH:quinone reductase